MSGSVAGFSHFTLLLVQALREQFSKVRVFAFVERADEVTHLFAPGNDLATVMSRVLREAVTNLLRHADTRRCWITVRATRLSVVNNGIEWTPSAKDKAAARQSFGLPDSYPLLVATGRFVPQKNYDLMVRAMGALERGRLQLTKQSDDGVT